MQLGHALGHAGGVVRVLEDRLGQGATWLIHASADLIAEVTMRLVASLHQILLRLLFVDHLILHDVILSLLELVGLVLGAGALLDLGDDVPVLEIL